MLQTMIKQTEKVKETKTANTKKRKQQQQQRMPLPSNHSYLKVFLMSLVNFPFSFFAF